MTFSHETEAASADTDATKTRAILEEVTRFRNSFLANLSHELRTPLNAVIGFAELMVNESFGPIPPRYHEYAGHILLSGNHLLRVINDILDLSKITSGQFELDIEPVELRATMLPVLESFRLPAAEKQLTLDCLVPASLVIMADARRLRQIVMNLLSNAVKFTPAGGRIVLEAEELGDEIRFSVTDTGIGMTEEEILVALLPFGQISKGAHERQAGSGLGLPLVSQLVERQNGRTRLTSRPGEGTRAEVTLPAWRQDQACRSAEAASSA
jgi:two-component system cell cycle sensor histidine kinase PleC